MIYSCLQNVMGKIFVTDLERPESAFAFVGSFGFFAGKPNRELVVNKPDGFVILTPPNEEWAALIEECLKEGPYPSWDAQNMNSVRLAEKLGYEFDREYTAYEVVT
ncbi:MAG: GNAT family N-acetyltransferase [Candidatus Coproplasma sp.]